jgi:catechol 2,3-dioxygenase-like lactoylglutathione lyase family enzyme
MDWNTVEAPAFGRSLAGLGLNIVVRDVPRTVRFLQQVFGMEAFRLSDKFAILRYGQQIFQLHSDATYGANPLLGLLPELEARGAGVELRLYDSDPDAAVSLARRLEGATILQEPTDKPHGLREAYILCPDGYAWVPSLPLAAAPTKANPDIG